MTNPNYILESLQSLVIPVSTLSLDAHNLRRHPDRNLKAIMSSLKEFGQRKPIVVQKKGDELIVRAGNGTLQATMKLKREFIAAVIIEEDDDTAAAFALADNRSADLAEWDDYNLAKSLQQMQNNGLSLESLGFSDKEFQKLVDKMAGEKPEPKDKKDKGQSSEQEFIILINCNDETEQSELYAELCERGVRCKLV